MKVVFKNPDPSELDAQSKQVPMEVLEVNGDRVLVEALTTMGIRSTHVYMMKDLVVIAD